jgi:DNA-binding Lrp family transcriptional regulator
MQKAIVLITTEPGSESDVLKGLKRIEGVEEAYATYGVYDILVKVQAESGEKLKEVITQRIRRLDKVRSTLTMIITEEAKSSPT